MLDVAFSSAVDSIGLLFALNGLEGNSLSLTAFSGGIGGTIVGSTFGVGVVPLGFFFPEGALSFSGAVFDAVSISSTAQDFALDDITVTEVPEPTSLVLTLTGLVGPIALTKGRLSS